MKSPTSRFGALSQAIRDRTADADAAKPVVVVPSGAGIHKPAAALGLVAEGLRDRIHRLESSLASATDDKASLLQELSRARGLSDRAGDTREEFLFLDPALITDRLPRDRLPGAFEGVEFEALLEDIRANGQNDAITLRRDAAGGYEIAAGRRRLEACRRLQVPVLARIRTLDEAAMLRVQFSENERREDISALERARWFAEVRSRLDMQARDVAAQFGLDPSTLSLYLRLARFPAEIVERLREPRRLAVLRARRVMEAIEADGAALPRILQALDGQIRAAGGDKRAVDADAQITLLMQASEGREPSKPETRAALPERRHIVHEGHRIGTLTRNGGQWVFRFATSLPDAMVLAISDRLPGLVAEFKED